MKLTTMIATVLCMILGGVFAATATPSTIIWIPSVDFQGYKSFHLGIDNYSYDFKSGKPYSGGAFPTDLGLTVIRASESASAVFPCDGRPAIIIRSDG